MTTLARGLTVVPWQQFAGGRRPVLLAGLSVLAGAATILAGVGLIATSGFLVSRAAERPPILDLMVVFTTVRFFGLARPVLRYAERLVSHDLTFRILAAVRRWFVAALLPLSQGQLAGYRAGDLLSRLASDVETMQEAWLRVAAPAAVATLTTIIVVAALAWIDLALGLVVCAIIVFNGLVWSWIAHRMATGLGARQNAHRRALSADLVMVTQGLEDILAFGHERAALERVAARQRDLDALEDQYGGRQALHTAAGLILTNLAFAAALLLTLAAADAGQLPPVWIAAISLAVVASFEAIEGLPAAWQFAARTAESAARVHEVAVTRPAVVEDPFPVRLTIAPVPALEFRDVTFGYGGRNILEHVSLCCGPGEHVLVTGATGSGKSTLLSVAMRAWDPTNGHVTLNGVDMRYLGLADLRQAIAVLPQQIHVFNATLRENVRLARSSATDAEVIEALRRAQLTGFLDRLPQGLDTVLGEFGATISAGERQRLGFARLLLTEASVVLADEPTANLDVTCEQAILDELSAWAEGRTMILVSHRPIARVAVDRVLSIRDGKIGHLG
jgi:thiol reductant ABC exporter CydC subunit